MDVLVDYNNLREVDRRRGPLFVIDKILNALGPARIGSTGRMRIRLYDGWYNQLTLTRRRRTFRRQLNLTRR